MFCMLDLIVISLKSLESVTISSLGNLFVGKIHVILSYGISHILDLAACTFLVSFIMFLYPL